MYNHSDQSLPLVYSFPDSKDGDAVRVLFRANVCGGISNVNHRYQKEILSAIIKCNLRHVDLMTNESPVNARFAPNGWPFTSILFLDVNSMYLDAEKKDMPLTPGFRWTKTKGKYYKKVHLSFGTSFKSLQWLYWLEQELKSNGHDGVLHHQYHQGETKICGYRVDGFTTINGREVIYEFHGNLNVIEKIIM